MPIASLSASSGVMGVSLTTLKNSVSTSRFPGSRTSTLTWWRYPVVGAWPQLVIAESGTGTSPRRAPTTPCAAMASRTWPNARSNDWRLMPRPVPTSDRWKALALTPDLTALAMAPARLPNGDTIGDHLPSWAAPRVGGGHDARGGACPAPQPRSCVRIGNSSGSPGSAFGQVTRRTLTASSRVSNGPQMVYCRQGGLPEQKCATLIS